MLCIWWDQLDVVYYKLLKPNEIIAGAVSRTQLMRLSRALKEKRAHYYSRHDKVILQHGNAHPHVVALVITYSETLKWEVLPHPPYLSDIASSDFHLYNRNFFWGILPSLKFSNQLRTLYFSTLFMNKFFCLVLYAKLTLFYRNIIKYT